MAACRLPSHSASRPIGHPKQRSPSSNSSTKCAISSWPYTRPNSRTPRENDGSRRQRSRRSSRTTNFHFDWRYQLTNGAIGPVLCFGSANPPNRLLRRRRSRVAPAHQRKTTDLHRRPHPSLGHRTERTVDGSFCPVTPGRDGMTRFGKLRRACQFRGRPHK